ncbi:hypothetical protein OV079_34610 [Nannocystis pusilla]|uniref:Uncharacterized protein n=1 Tax=Nannocystis pusilla TaxID=889268 RepID=A0A9X3F392_9BACT|nr:hypothetical protein [Nannocystis pusilla]
MKYASNREWLAAEPFTLALSAGFFGFFAHTGCCRRSRRPGFRRGGSSG